MSAITGIFYRDGRNVDPQLIKKMNDILSHRGPDGSATWCEGPVGLGHQMLWTTQESLQEKLPLEEDGLVITADARIDNRAELSQELDIEDAEHVADSYFILKAYQKWGEDCPDKLLGDFAFAIWDKNKEQLFCARDHMGVKPFYYYLDDDMFVFGTEIKALFCVDGVPEKINEMKIAHHLIPISTERSLTFYENIFRLSASHNFVITSNKFYKKKYWELNPDLEIKLASDEDYYSKFYQLFQDSIQRKLRSAYKIGFELSGGIDSSSVVLMAKNIISNENKPIKTFSLVFDEIKETDESFYIQKVVETGQIEPYYLIADSISPFQEIDEILYYNEGPSQTPNIAMVWQLYKKMHQNGIRIILGGHDGDCLLYKGEKYLMELFVNLKWKKLIQEINNLANIVNVNRFKLFISKVIFPLSPKTANIWRKYKGIRQEKDLVNLNQEFVKKLHLKKEYKENFFVPFTNANTSKKMHYYYLTSGTHQLIFEMMDKIAGAFFIEPRHPMMDKRLLEFCYGVPTEIKYNKGWGRLLVRIGLSALLPDEIQWRIGKRNFFHVFERNLLLFEKNRLDDLIYKNKFTKKYSNCLELPKIYKRYKNGIKGADSIDIWKIAILSLWLNKNRKNI